MSEIPSKKESFPKKIFRWTLAGALLFGAAKLLVAAGSEVSGVLHKAPKAV